MLQNESPSAAFPTVFASYRITRLIGRGGMGEVYEGVHERTGAPLAIKVLMSDFGGKTDLLARFKREAEISSRLRHPNIVKVFDFDQLPDGRPFIAMELLSGVPLDAVLEPGVPMPLPRVASILEQVALGLEAAHSASVVHRDLKPANLFLETLPGAGRELVRILDFGISKIRDASSNLTQTMAIIGTPHYMSPEQAMGRTRDIDGRSDQFSLASIIFELLTGRSAFGPDDPNSEDPAAAVLFRVVHAAPPTLASLNVELPAAAQAALLRALSKEPAARFESITLFAKAFLRPLRAVLDADRDRATEVLAVCEPYVPSLALPTPVPADKVRLDVTRFLPAVVAVSVAPAMQIEEDEQVPPRFYTRRLITLLAGAALIVAVGILVLRSLLHTPDPNLSHKSTSSPSRAENARPSGRASRPEAPSALPEPVSTRSSTPPVAPAAAPSLGAEPTPKPQPARKRRRPERSPRNEDIL